MRDCYILQGISGSGKSTLAKERFPSGKILSTDDFFMEDGKYNFNPSKLGEAHDRNLRNFLTAIGSNVPLVVVDNTNTTVWELAPYYRMAEISSYKTSIIRVLCDPKEAFARNAHGCPLKALEGQHRHLKEQADLLPPWWPVEIIST